MRRRKKMKAAIAGRWQAATAGSGFAGSALTALSLSVGSLIGGRSGNGARRERRLKRSPWSSLRALRAAGIGSAGGGGVAEEERGGGFGVVGLEEGESVARGGADFEIFVLDFLLLAEHFEFE